MPKDNNWIFVPEASWIICASGNTSAVTHTHTHSSWPHTGKVCWPLVWKISPAHTNPVITSITFRHHPPITFSLRWRVGVTCVWVYQWNAWYGEGGMGFLQILMWTVYLRQTCVIVRSSQVSGGHVTLVVITPPLSKPSSPWSKVINTSPVIDSRNLYRVFSTSVTFLRFLQRSHFLLLLS